MTPSRARQIPAISVVPSEIRSARDVTRQIGQMLDAVNDGSAEKVVIMRSGRMAGVLVSADRYAELTASFAETEQEQAA